MREPWCRIPLGDTDALDTLAAPRIAITSQIRDPFFFLEGGQQRGLTWRIIPVSISQGFVVPLPNGLSMALINGSGPKPLKKRPS